MTVKIKICLFPKFLREWKLSDITGMISASEFMKKSGLTSAVYIADEYIWELSNADYIIFLLKWS